MDTIPPRRDAQDRPAAELRPPLKYPQPAQTLRQGGELFHSSKVPLAIDIAAFWRWGFSNLIDNTTRGALAEFIVASQLGLTAGPRSAWDAYDLRVGPDGPTIEVKASAYLQAWGQKELSQIKFSIRPSLGWNSATGVFSPPPARRQAEVYIFCVETCTDRATFDPLDVMQWDFYVLGTKVLNRKCALRSMISLASLLKCEAMCTPYEKLESAVSAAAAMS